MSEFIGPALPDHLKSKELHDSDDDNSEIAGPSLPPEWRENDDKEEEEKEEIIGPVLPKELRLKNKSIDYKEDDRSLKKQKISNQIYIGPALPPEFSKQKGKVNYDDEPNIGPKLPLNKQEDDDNDDDDDVECTIGPLPPSANFIEIEEKRHQRHQQIASSQSGSKREEWIASCPENSSVAKKLGFGKSVTSFSQKPVTSDEIKPFEQDEELCEAVDQYNKSTRPDSLSDLHKKLKNKKKIDEPPKRELFDFDPERDLKVKQMDPTHARSIMEKAKLMNSRFSNPRGSNKFL